jgi:hypothetical protein
MHPRRSSKLLAPLALMFISLAALAAQDITLPNKPDSLKFAIIGDSGTGSKSQYSVADKLVASRAKFPYEFVLMMGDNLYIGSDAKDFQKAFETPYKPLLDAGVKFYAALGNHDNPNERFYKGFNMNGDRFYTFKPKPGIRIFALDSNYMDKPQKGIYYFTSGGAAKLREGDVNATELTAKKFDTGYHFMLLEIVKDTLNFQVISDQGKTVDSGVLPRFSDQEKKKLATGTQE